MRSQSSGSSIRAKRPRSQALPSRRRSRPTFTKLVLAGSEDDVSDAMKVVIADGESGFVGLIDRKAHQVSEDFCAKDVCGINSRTLDDRLVVLTMERMHHDLFDVISGGVEDDRKLESVVQNKNKNRLIKEVGGYIIHLATQHGYIFSDIKPENVGVDFDEKQAAKSQKKATPAAKKEAERAAKTKGRKAVRKAAKQVAKQVSQNTAKQWRLQPSVEGGLHLKIQVTRLD